MLSALRFEERGQQAQRMQYHLGYGRSLHLTSSRVEDKVFGGHGLEIAEEPLDVEVVGVVHCQFDQAVLEQGVESIGLLTHLWRQVALDLSGPGFVPLAGVGHSPQRNE